MVAPARSNGSGFFHQELMKTSKSAVLTMSRGRSFAQRFVEGKPPGWGGGGRSTGGGPLNVTKQIAEGHGLIHAEAQTSRWAAGRPWFRSRSNGLVAANSHHDLLLKRNNAIESGRTRPDDIRPAVSERQSLLRMTQAPGDCGQIIIHQ